MEAEVQNTDGSGDEKSSPRKRARSVKMVDVKIIHREGHAALVEYIDKGEPFRVVVPNKAVEGKQVGKVAKTELEAGTAYGDDFTQIEGVGPELAYELKRIGVWVKADLIGRSSKLVNAIQQVTVVPILKALLEFAKEE